MEPHLRFLLLLAWLPAGVSMSAQARTLEGNARMRLNLAVAANVPDVLGGPSGLRQFLSDRLEAVFGSAVLAEAGAADSSATRSREAVRIRVRWQNNALAARVRPPRGAPVQRAFALQSPTEVRVQLWVFLRGVLERLQASAPPMPSRAQRDTSKAGATAAPPSQSRQQDGERQWRLRAAAASINEAGPTWSGGVWLGSEFTGWQSEGVILQAMAGYRLGPVSEGLQIHHVPLRLGAALTFGAAGALRLGLALVGTWKWALAGGPEARANATLFAVNAEPFVELGVPVAGLVLHGRLGLERRTRRFRYVWDAGELRENAWAVSLAFGGSWGFGAPSASQKARARQD